MMKKEKLVGVEIKKLNNYHNVNISLENRANIFVGENGLGKTTILNIIYYTLKRDYAELSNYEFESISLNFKSGNNISITLNEIKFGTKVLEKLSQNIKEHKLFKNEQKKIFTNQMHDTDTFDFMQSYLNDYKKEIKQKNKKVKSTNEKIGYNMLEKFLEFEQKSREKVTEEIIYLTTYRRIENNFEDIKVSGERRKSLINFGMSDVQVSINRIIDEIRLEATKSFSDMTGVLLKQYIDEGDITFDVNKNKINKETVEIVLGRVGTKIEDKDKNRIIEMIQDKNFYNSNNMYLINLLNKLIENYEKQKDNDEKLKKFITICNSYFNDKYFSYDESSLTINIVLKKNNGESEKIELDKLSSGEKQIVSIFSYLFLESKSSSILLIDEPELSLSIPWQRKLLPDILKSENCEMLLSVTHSPFIFDNELENNVTEIFLMDSWNRK